MGGEFHLTQGGHAFYFGTMPKIASSLERIADALEKEAVIGCDHEWTPVQYDGMCSGMACTKCKVLLKEKDLETLDPCPIVSPTILQETDRLLRECDAIKSGNYHIDIKVAAQNILIGLLQVKWAVMEEKLKGGGK